jgi:hypothetical protein
VPQKRGAQSDDGAYCASLEALLRGVGLSASSTAAQAAAVGALRDPAGVNLARVVAAPAGRQGRLPRREAAVRGGKRTSKVAAKEASDVEEEEEEEEASDAEGGGAAGGGGGAAGGGGGAAQAADSHAGAAAGGR